MRSERFRSGRLLAVLLVASAWLAGRVVAQPMADDEYTRIVANLRAADEDDRVAAAEAIGRRGHRFRDRAGPALRDLLRSDPSPNVRASAGRALGRLGYRPAVPELVRGLRDSAVDVRVVCAVALWRLPDPAAVPALIDSTRDSDEAVREWVALALGVVRDRRATEALAPLLDDPVPSVRLAAIRSLGRVGDVAALAPLRRFLARRTVPLEERREVVSALGQMRSPERLDLLVTMLGDSDASVRIAVAGTLGQAGDALNIPALRRHLRDREASVRSAMQQAIRAIQQRAADAGTEASDAGS